MLEINSLIEALHLELHPEGGYYREMHRSQTIVYAVNSLEQKSAYTSIYYLLSGGDFSSWHRIKSDETWFFHYGCDVLIHLFNEDKMLETIQLGLEAKKFQMTLVANTWFSAQITNEASFCLVSCVVAPGFEFDEFEIAKREQLLIEYGSSDKHIEAIKAFTRS